MSRKVLGESAVHQNKTNSENKGNSEDSTIERLIQEKKQLLQEQSFQLLLVPQRFFRQFE